MKAAFHQRENPFFPFQKRPLNGIAKETLFSFFKKNVAKNAALAEGRIKILRPRAEEGIYKRLFRVSIPSNFEGFLAPQGAGVSALQRKASRIAARQGGKLAKKTMEEKLGRAS